MNNTVYISQIENAVINLKFCLITQQHGKATERAVEIAGLAQDIYTQERDIQRILPKGQNND